MRASIINASIINAEEPEALRVACGQAPSVHHANLHQTRSGSDQVAGALQLNEQVCRRRGYRYRERASQHPLHGQDKAN